MTTMKTATCTIHEQETIKTTLKFGFKVIYILLLFFIGGLIWKNNIFASSN